VDLEELVVAGKDLEVARKDVTVARKDLAALRHDLQVIRGEGREALEERVEKLRDQVPQDTADKLQEVLPDPAAVKRGVLAFLGLAARKAEVAASRAAGLSADAAARADEAAAALVDSGSEASDVASVVGDLATTSARRSRTVGRVVVATLALGALAGAGYAVYRRRRATPAEAWPPPDATEFQPGVADVDSPDVVDEQFAGEVDAVAEELAEDFVAAAAADAEAEPEGDFQPGMADTESPDVVDDDFAREVDAVADEIAGDIVDKIEQPPQQ